MYVVVLAWNHWEDTRECLDSLRQSHTESMQILVVDNGSSDGTSEHVRADYPDVELVSLPKNIGIMQGYNMGIEKALERGAEYIVVMNNDTSADPRMLAELQAALDADMRVAVAVPKIVYYDDPQRIWAAGARWRAFPPGVKFIGLDQPDGPRFDNPVEIQFATSCCLMLRTDALKVIGLFDPTYIFYYDDWDLALRVRQHDYKLMFVPQARLRHKVAVTTRKADRSGYYSSVQGRASVYFYLRYIGWTALTTMTAWIVLRDLLAGQWRNVLPYLRGVWQGLREIRQQGAGR